MSTCWYEKTNKNISHLWKNTMHPNRDQTRGLYHSFICHLKSICFVRFICDAIPIAGYNFKQDSWRSCWRKHFLPFSSAKKNPLCKNPSSIKNLLDEIRPRTYLEEEKNVAHIRCILFSLLTNKKPLAQLRNLAVWRRNLGDKRIFLKIPH